MAAAAIFNILTQPNQLQIEMRYIVQFTRTSVRYTQKD